MWYVKTFFNFFWGGNMVLLCPSGTSDLSNKTDLNVLKFNISTRQQKDVINWLEFLFSEWYWLSCNYELYQSNFRLIPSVFNYFLLPANRVSQLLCLWTHVFFLNCLVRWRIFTFALSLFTCFNSISISFSFAFFWV